MKAWKTGYKYLILSLICHLLIVSQAFALEVQERYLRPGNVAVGRSRGNEYVSGDTNPDTVLIRVNLWGAIGKPGIHFIPYHTDILTLFSYAGGPSEGADLDDIVIRRQEAGKQNLIHVNFNKIIREGNYYNPQLEANDLIVINGGTKVNVMQSIMSGMQLTLTSMSLLLTLFIVKDKLKNP